jgi:transcription elongation factor Elf1
MTNDACPFCGSLQVGVVETADGRAARCGNCGAQGPVATSDAVPEGKATISYARPNCEAMRKWREREPAR